MSDGKMLPMLDDYDWGEAFGYAGDPDASFGGGLPELLAADGTGLGQSTPIGRGDVAEVVASSEGEHDVADWLGLFRLHDGRFLGLRAGCDYTGWD